LGALGAVLAVILVGHVYAAAGGSDSSGYMNLARLLAHGHIRVAARTLTGLNGKDFPDYLYTPLGFHPHGMTLTPTYPVGLPVMIAGSAVLFGWQQAANVVIVLHALAAVLLVCAIARELSLGWRGAFAACVCLAASPLFLYYSVQNMSDVPALTWTCATAWAALRARQKPMWAALAGAAFSIAILIRPTDILLAPALAIAWWPLLRPRTLYGILGGLPLAVGLALYSWHAYGSPWSTGYGDAASLFRWANVGPSALNYVKWLPLLFTPGVVLFLILFRRPTWKAAFLAAWGTAFLFFYLWYFHTHEAWWYLRFVLPAAPALILGAIWVLRPITAAIRARDRALVAALAAILITDISVAYAFHLPVLSSDQNERAYFETMSWVDQHLSEESVLVCMQASGAAFYYTPCAVVRWDQIERPQWDRIAQAAAQDHRPLYAVLFPFETAPALRGRTPGNWKPLANLRGIAVWQWAGPVPPP
jgi:hypothetical protein